ncbi:hypothetical protein C8A05DRAFT_41642 [Staphylotrichum tortipilum]|uniref:ASX DEUBAD domain-containing protein n=1 Tax=Staphylotrichum tortipilum TaxID=2831512 RepID=A0AAN6MR87_9PEZI|nr:hypothetical protein C8A05DRAFT_41642 [Staphylotrichum longicolle]
MASHLAGGFPSSPLSSPPPSPSESVINVVIESPAKPKAEPEASTAASPTQKATVEAVEVAARPSPSSQSGDGEITVSVPHESDDGVQSSGQKRKASVSRKPPQPKKARRIVLATKRSDRKWEAPFVYTDTKSPLAHANLRVCLSLSSPVDEEKQEVLAKFPDNTHILDAGTPNACPNPVSLRNDDNFRYDCARYCENIELGRHDEEWLNQAWTAHEKHKRGDFDQFLRDQFEGNWDTKLPSKDEAGESESKKLDTGESKQVETETAESSQLDAKELSGKRKPHSQPDLETAALPTGSPRTSQLDSGQVPQDQEAATPIAVIRSD